MFFLYIYNVFDVIHHYLRVARTKRTYNVYIILYYTFCGDGVQSLLNWVEYPIKTTGRCDFAPRRVYIFIHVYISIGTDFTHVAYSIYRSMQGPLSVPSMNTRIAAVFIIHNCTYNYVNTMQDILEYIYCKLFKYMFDTVHI